VTKNNPLPNYNEFHQRFYKFPSYLRRAAIACALGKIKSYRFNFQNWLEEKELAEQEGKVFKKNPPCLSLTHQEFPILYKGNMYSNISDNEAHIKVFHQNDWVWISVQTTTQDLFKRDVHDWKRCNPKLVKVGKKYFLMVSYEKEIKLNQTKTKDKRICTVDLGITNSAVCSIMTSNGTVLARKFINQPKEKDRLYRMTNKLRKVQQQSGYIKAPTYWRTINGLQQHVVNNTSSEIVKFAQKHNCDVIVFEYLGKMRTPKGFWGAKKLRFKLRYWRKIGVQNKIEEMAHYLGMRISRINPRNTSALAFDGSGKVERSYRKDLCVFSNGKNYHSDLNATYNIGARYFIRETLKTLSETIRLSIQAKVPEFSFRTKQTLATLISLQKALG
jgi:putative transposase